MLQEKSMNIKIRPWKMEDAKDLAKSLNNSKIHNYLRDGLPLPYTIADAEAFISLMLAADPGITYAWAITIDDIAVGSIGVVRKDNVHHFTAEMGYYVAEEYWGKGVMTEAVKQACRYIFTNTDIVRISAETYTPNIASYRVLEKAGFVYEGTLRKSAVKNGQFLDMRIYAIIKE
jgi:RimJ/RimL family protein N-acetyltransferase